MFMDGVDQGFEQQKIVTDRAHTGTEQYTVEKK